MMRFRLIDGPVLSHRLAARKVDARMTYVSE